MVSAVRLLNRLFFAHFWTSGGISEMWRNSSSASRDNSSWSQSAGPRFCDLDLTFAVTESSCLSLTHVILPVGEILCICLALGVIQVVIRAGNAEHVVYSLILQSLGFNVCLSVLWNVFNILLLILGNPETYLKIFYQAYVNACSFSALLHDITWCAIGVLRYLKIVKRDTVWSHLDMDRLRVRCHILVWLIFVALWSVSLTMRISFSAEYAQSDIMAWPIDRIGFWLFLGFFSFKFMLLAFVAIATYFLILRHTSLSSAVTPATAAELQIHGVEEDSSSAENPPLATAEEEDKRRVVAVAKRALVSTAASALFHLAVPLAILIYRFPGTSGSVVVKRNLAKTSIVWVKMFEKNIASLLTPLSNMKPLMNYVSEFCHSHCAKTTQVEVFSYDSALSTSERN